MLAIGSGDDSDVEPPPAIRWPNGCKSSRSPRKKSLVSKRLSSRYGPATPPLRRESKLLVPSIAEVAVRDGIGAGICSVAFAAGEISDHWSLGRAKLSSSRKAFQLIDMAKVVRGCFDESQMSGVDQEMSGRIEMPMEQGRAQARRRWADARNASR